MQLQAAPQVGPPQHSLFSVGFRQSPHIIGWNTLSVRAGLRPHSSNQACILGLTGGGDRQFSKNSHRLALDGIRLPAHRLSKWFKTKRRVLGIFSLFLHAGPTACLLLCCLMRIAGSLGIVNVDEKMLDVRPGGPLHSASCDVLCSDADRWLADVHGPWFASPVSLRRVQVVWKVLIRSAGDDCFRRAVLALLLWSGALCLVHCSLADFHPKSNAVGKEPAPIVPVLCLRPAFLLFSDASLHSCFPFCPYR